MDGILIIDKPKGFTSRDVVNSVCKIFNTKKVGHTGTLDPIATGVLVVCLGKATKLVEILTSDEKEYIATVELGILTDTLDISGNIIKRQDIILKEDDLKKVLNSFIGFYEQEVPLYSAVKINGRKLYEYARKKEDIVLPKRKVEIKDIELLNFNTKQYKFKVTVSKGTYIRSLIRDINNKLNIIGVMSNLKRTKQGNFSIEDSYTLEDIENNKYKILSITSAINDSNTININNDMYIKIKNGQILDNIYNKDIVKFMYNGEIISIYKVYDKDNSKIKPFKMFI